MPLDCVILAAGCSSRFGGCKLLADWQGQPLVTHAIAAVKALAVENFVLGNFVIVGGAYYSQLATLIGRLPEPKPQLLYCADWAEGMGRSLAFAAAQLPAANALMVLLADMPLVTAEDLTRLQQLWQNNPHNIVCSRFGDTLSVPAIFPAELKTQLLALRGDKGAKALFAAHADALLSLPLAAAEFDVDTPADLARLLQESRYDFAQD